MEADRIATSMRVLITGAAGQVGAAVVDALVRAEHTVLALVRTPQQSELVAAAGATPVLGDLTTPSTYVASAGEVDAVVHAAYDGRDAEALDRLALDHLLPAVEARARAGAMVRFLYTSSAWVVGTALEPAEETAAVEPPENLAWRPAHEQRVLRAAGDRLRTAVVRPGVVYGGARGLIADMLKEAGQGLVRVVGKGKNHWPCVYDRDLADLYLRLLTSEDTAGVYHANDEADERVIDIVEAVVGHVRTPTDIRHMPLAEARAKLGPLAEALTLDQKLRSVRARALGWAPTLHSVAGNVARLLEEFRDAKAAA
jgi:nucleoside-diphosphate-sugar epimerase